MNAARFHIKKADLASIFPAVAGPAVGGFAGRALGVKYPGLGPELGALLGGVTGGVGGQLIKERVESNSDIPPGAPYAIDSSTTDIPPWALQGAQMLQPHMKAAGAMDWILGEIPGASVVQGGVRHGLGGAARAFAGMSGGGVAGGLAGLGAGKAIEHFTGPVNVPLVNLPLHELLAGVGGSIGATKGLRHLSPEKNEGA